MFSPRTDRPPVEEEPPTVRPTVSLLPPVPIARSSSWTPIALMVLLGVAATFLVLRWTGALDATVQRVRNIAANGAAQNDLSQAPPAPPDRTTPTETAEPAPEEDFTSRADDSLRRWGKSNVSRGIMIVPPTFVSEDGSYDSIIHFHGNTELVAEGMTLTGINAVVVIYNYGNGSGAYEERFYDPSRLTDMLQHVQADLRGRGLMNPRLRRLALTSWSAGYGAIQGILSQPKLVDSVDAILMFDGMHASYLGDGPDIAPTSLAPFVAFAERAVNGEKLFVLTHSNVEPIGYVGVAKSADFLLEKVHVERKPVTGDTPMPAYKSLDGIWPKGEMVTLQKRTEAREGGLVIRGYGGNQTYHHIAHLAQFPETAMPLLIERWKRH